MQQPLSWRDEALVKSEAITDAWEVTKTYAGRLAEWILFLCMVANIIEILPGVSLSGWLTNTILGVQAVTLDIAGFGLASMAQQALASGETEAARKAKHTAYWLIALMMVTVLSVSIGTLWPTAKPSTDMADKVLILIRVAATVWYGHVLHDLRAHTRPMVFIPVLEEQLDQMARSMAELQSRQETQLSTLRNAVKEMGHYVASLPKPEPLNYVALAEAVTPLLPKPEMPNYEGLTQQIVMQIAHQQARREQEVNTRIAALQARLEGFAQTEANSEPPKSEPIHLQIVKRGERQSFIYEYLSEHPEASISTIINAAKAKGLTLSQGYVSEQRKLYLEKEQTA